MCSFCRNKFKNNYGIIITYFRFTSNFLSVLLLFIVLFFEINRFPDVIAYYFHKF